ncbi:hypothetical protein AU255_15250 [Methyloprofundus sedimenti]|uniref:Uncharacterized protein n=1 Tax=Methyloprofundus sedimenti TaxID=1420851 RepID=A0A1V8M1Z5_9GAMM|nr:hypothetical protein [Methyloprofundus sedimenti]OQK15580.1 hypothetical protein AU255_15250 [Methyloprofundus sedimenti]
MNTFHKILFTVIFAVTASSAFAVANPSYTEVRAAIVNTLAKVQEARTALDNGAETEIVIDMVTEARQIQKDIANNVLDVKRNRASSVLKNARTALKNGELEFVVVK